MKQVEAVGGFHPLNQTAMFGFDTYSEPRMRSLSNAALVAHWLSAPDQSFSSRSPLASERTRSALSVICVKFDMPKLLSVRTSPAASQIGEIWELDVG